jgi:hypothetical protein
MSILEVIGAFALFFIVVVAAGTAAGVIKWNIEITKP